MGPSKERDEVTAPAVLALADGSIFRGQSIGAAGNTTGEVVFNTAITGYQEILTDPSYARQIVTLTYPHIGNTGVNSRGHGVGADLRRRAGDARSVAGREQLARRRHPREFLQRGRVVAIAGIDTRRLTRLLREKGAQSGCIMTGERIDEAAAVRAARAFPGLKGMDLAKVVSTRAALSVERRQHRARSAGAAARARSACTWSPTTTASSATSCGCSPIRAAASRWCRRTTSAADVLALNPDGVFLSNGPAIRSPATTRSRRSRELLETDMPIFGICLGHQLLGLASGAQTVKMKFGHHGANHPVQELATGRVMITSQNHGFAVDEATLPANLRADAPLAVRRHACRAWRAPTGRPSASRVIPRRAPARTTSSRCSRRSCRP